MGKECGAWVSRRLWGGSNTSPLKTTAWEAKVGEVQDLTVDISQMSPVVEFLDYEVRGSLPRSRF